MTRQPNMHYQSETHHTLKLFLFVSKQDIKCVGVFASKVWYADQIMIWKVLVAINLALLDSITHIIFPDAWQIDELRDIISL